jgi:3-hydroxyisobutyrate dehydrogenase-like beta-hydroxyacid dehydrogenase
VLFGTQGFITSAPQLARIVICSTLSPRYLYALHPRVPAHIALIDAPMSGAAIAAQEARLTFMLGAQAAEVEALRPLLMAMGRQIHHMGPFGAGMEAKVLNNLLAASSTAMTRLVLDWADAAGIDQTRLMALIAASSGQNWFASHFDAIEFARDGHSDDNSIGILVKDVESALDAAPKGAATDLPRQVQAALRGLRPR